MNLYWTVLRFPDNSFRYFLLDGKYNTGYAIIYDNNKSDLYKGYQANLLLIEDQSFDCVRKQLIEAYFTNGFC